MAFTDSAMFDPNTYGSDDNRRALADALRGPQSEPIPNIAHGSIPGLLGIALSDQMRAARANLDARGSQISSPPSRTDAPANTPMGGPAPPWAGGGALMPVPPPPANAGGGPAPALPPPINVPPAPGNAMGSVAPIMPRPPSPALAQAAASAPSAADNSLIPKDSLLGRLLTGIGNFRDQNRMTLLAMAGGLAGAPSIGTGLSRAFTAAAQAAPFDIKQNQQNQTMQALINRGIPPDVARAASTNPAILQQMLPQLFGAKQLQHVTIKDSLGNDIPMTFDPATGRYRDMGGNVIGGTGGATGAAGATAGVPGLAGAAATLPVEIDPGTGRDEKFLAALNPVDRAAVTSILNGDTAAAGRNMQKYLPYAARAEPGFSQQTYTTRLQTMKDFAPQGVSGKNLTAISTGLGHLDRLNQAIDTLGNFTIAPGAINPIYNAARSQFSPDYQRNVAAFRQDVNAVSGEMAKAFRATGMSEADIDHWRNSFNENSSPETMKAAAQEALHLLDSRLEAIGAAYNRGMGLSSTKPAPELLSPEGRRIHERLTSGERTATTAPTTAAAAAPAPPKVGDVKDGYRFKGGNPADPHSWEPVK